MKCRTKTAKQKKAPPKGEKIMAKRVFIIVLDSFGIGEMPDAARFGAPAPCGKVFAGGGRPGETPVIPPPYSAGIVSPALGGERCAST